MGCPLCAWLKLLGAEDTASANSALEILEGKTDAVRLLLQYTRLATLTTNHKHDNITPYDPSSLRQSVWPSVAHVCPSLPEPPSVRAPPAAAARPPPPSAPPKSLPHWSKAKPGPSLGVGFFQSFPLSLFPLPCVAPRRYHSPWRPPALPWQWCGHAPSCLPKKGRCSVKRQGQNLFLTSLKASALLPLLLLQPEESLTLTPFARWNLVIWQGTPN